MKNCFKYFFIVIIFLFIQGNSYIINAQKNAVWHNDKGLMYFKEGLYYEAAYEFKLAILLSSNTSASATFYNNLGLVYHRAGKDDWALQCFQKAIKMNPNFLEYYQNMIKVYKSRKMLSDVENKYNKWTKSPNASSKTWLILGLTYLELGKYDEAITCLNKFKKLEPNLILTQGVDRILDNFK